MTYHEMEAGIYAVPRFGGNSGPSNIIEYLKLMNCPEDSLRVIHVAGTNGKGSVCAFIESILQQAGYRTGLFSSPHLIRLNERYKINGQPVEDEVLIRAWEEVSRIIKRGAGRGLSTPTWFEIIYLMGMWIFAGADIDYCILETGMGGRLDATVTSHPLLTVITSISLDHMEVLGDTIEEIAFEKAGILKEGVPAVIWKEDDAAFQVLADEAKRKNVTIEKVSCDDVTILKKRKNKIDFSINNSYYRYEELSITAHAEYQVYNAALALIAVRRLLPDIDEEALREGLITMRWPGRMEEILPGVFLDGAHNPGAIRQVIKTLQEWEEEGCGLCLLFAVSGDKDYSEMIRLLSVIPWKRIYVTRISGARAASVSQVETCFKTCFPRRNSRLEEDRIRSFEDVGEAFHTALHEKQEDEYLLCIGSLYLVGEIQKIINTLSESEDMT